MRAPDVYYAPTGRPADVERDSVPLLHFLIFAFVVPLINHVVRHFQIALAVPGFFAITVSTELALSHSLALAESLPPVALKAAAMACTEA